MEKQNLKEIFREIYRSPPSNISTRCRRHRKKVELPEGLSSFTHIYHNDFVGQKPKKLKDDDVAICVYKYDPNNPESACGEGCLNVMTSTECIRGHCPCQDYCKNQRFQNCEYAKTKLFQTELLAEEDIKAGQFISEYCGEVISLEEANRRSQSYEAEGLKDAYIISLNSNYFIDATKKGSLARFINHSCLPNCETRKWTVLGELWVGIFAKEYNHVWEEGDDRYRVEEVPLYDSAEDELLSHIPETISPFKFDSLDGLGTDYSQKMEIGDLFGQELNSSNTVKPHNSVQVDTMSMNTDKVEVLESGKSKEQDMQQAFYQTSALLSGHRSNSASWNFSVGSGSSSKKKSQHLPKQKKRSSGGKQSNTKNIADLFPSKEVQEEVHKYEQIKNQAAANLKSVYDEIRPVIEKHVRDSQDNVPPNVGAKWLEVHRANYKADLNFNVSIIKNILDIAQKDGSGSKAGPGPKSSGSGDSSKG